MKGCGLMFRVLASDFDGTLTDGERLLSLEAVRMLRALQLRGVAVSLVSGMNYPSLFKLSLHLGCRGAVIAENGAVVSYGGEVRVLGDKDPSLRVLRTLKERFPSLKESWDNRYRSVDVGFERNLPKDEVSSFVERCSREVRFIDSGVAYHILDRRVDKGVGLRVAAGLMEVNPSDIAAVGDNENDLELFQEAGYSIALANAPQKLKDEADHVTAHPYGLGFVEAANLVMGRLKVKMVGLDYPGRLGSMDKIEALRRIGEHVESKGHIPVDLPREGGGFDSKMDYAAGMDLIVAYLGKPEDLSSLQPELSYAKWMGKRIVALTQVETLDLSLFHEIYEDPGELLKGEAEILHPH
ncbi:MAG: phosphoglycolate phosphatase [Candidatus Bathyarchaeia archaeon]